MPTAILATVAPQFRVSGSGRIRFARREPTRPGLTRRERVKYSLLVLETIMLVALGLSWFVKGRKILSGG